MPTFHDNSLEFMTDLLRLLDKQAQTSNLGESASGKESVYSVLLRLTGVTKNISFDIDKDPNSTSELKADKQTNLVDSFFKIHTKSTDLQLAEINMLLRAFKKRVTRYSLARQQIKLNRTRRLVAVPTNPLIAENLVKTNLDQTRRSLAKEQKKLKDAADLTGIVDQDISIQKALELSINNAVNVPEDTGELRNQLVSFLKSTGKEAADNIERLTLFKQEIQAEVGRLENAEKLLFDGIGTFSGADQKLSLLRVLDLLIFLTDRKKMKYDCSQCKFFREGKSNVCIFAGAGAFSLTPLVTITDQFTGDSVIGRLTKPINSCKQVWGLESNEYFSPSDSIVELLQGLLKD